MPRDNAKELSAPQDEARQSLYLSRCYDQMCSLSTNPPQMPLIYDNHSHGSTDQDAAAPKLKHRERLQWDEIEEDDDNMLVKLERPRLRQEFFDYLGDRTSEIKGLVSHHLSLQRHQLCTVANQSEWLHGDFNACIPITVSNWGPHRLLLRCPFPHMFGGLRSADKVDEKIRCEAATFAWISQCCKQVPIPGLWGFGLPSGLSFTPVAYLPWYLRAFEAMKNFWAWLCRRPRCVPFVPRQSQISLQSGYLLVDFIEKERGTMLSKMWPPTTDVQRRSFYKHLSRVMLNLASHPMEKIGSLTIHDSGEMTLSNRPLTLRLPLLENEGIPTNIPRGRCYSTTDSYLRDLLNCHDLKLTHQPNAVRNKYDAEAQMAVLTIMRALLHQFVQHDLQHGPFIFRLTDLHASNIFVDQNYNITSLPDLEWGCSLPIETQHPPFWLSGHELDDLGGEKEQDFDKMCVEFLSIFEREDNQQSPLGPGFCTRVMRDALEHKVHWFMATLNEPRATYNFFLDHLQPRFAPSHAREEEAIQFQQILAPYWSFRASDFINQKVSDKASYLDRVRSKYGPCST